MQLRSSAGFTLVELLIVVAMISILSAVGVPFFLGQVSEAKKAEIRSQANIIAVGLESYRNLTGQYYYTKTSQCSPQDSHTAEIESKILDKNNILSAEFNFCISPRDANTGYIISIYDKSSIESGLRLNDRNEKEEIGDF